jgi:hypothetical protein
MTSAELARALQGYAFHFTDEKQLQAGIAQALADLKVEFLAEVSLTPGDRLDFLLPADGIGIEVKTNDSKGGAALSSVTRQLWRYAKLDAVKELVLVTTRSKHRDLPPDILGKPVHVVYISGII